MSDAKCAINIAVNPILTSILDTDAYKLHMQQAIFHRYSHVITRSEFRCRGNDLLGEYVTDIREQIEMMCGLKLSHREFIYLRTFPCFQVDYLDWLRQFRFNPSQVQIESKNGELTIRISGPWSEVILWEVPLLAVISEVINRRRHPNITLSDIIQQLEEKLRHFRYLSADIDMSRFRVVDFGTRRRFSRQAQFGIITKLHKTFSYFVGTSNYQLARECGLSPIGTQAHEWFQAHQQISSNLANSQHSALQAWLEEYPHQPGIALTDCITTDAFLRDFNITFARSYQGLRHDSGDPIEWGEKVIAHYEKLGIDPIKKTLVFSDSLNLDKALILYRYFWKRINLVFGIGTDLTCDIPNVKPLNIVIKMIECNGKPVAKISDSPGKMICNDKKFFNLLRHAFNVSLEHKI